MTKHYGINERAFNDLVDTIPGLCEIERLEDCARMREVNDGRYEDCASILDILQESLANDAIRQVVAVAGDALLIAWEE